MNTYIFFRKDEHGKDFFYPIELRDNNDAVANAIGNPGTTKVETIGGEKVWPLPMHKQ
jgi:hypothetical protein